jgi:hypothetical protein
MLALATLVATPASAQLNGENILGDTGVKNASQPAPGFYAGFMYYRYDTDRINDRDGNQLTRDPSQPASMALDAYLPMIIYVTKAKVLGANVGMLAAVPTFANGALEAPGFNLDNPLSTGFADSYFVPLQLGWHATHADSIVSFGFFAPTGRYTFGANDNLGKGMWSYELAAGTTVYFDKAKTWSAATTGSWEWHTKKDGTESAVVGGVPLTGIRVGQLLTLEGGLGKSFLEGAANVGLAYYAQYKLTDDDFGVPVLSGGNVIGRHRVWALGPDVTVPIAAKSKLIALVTARYFWEVDARVKTQGQSLIINTTFPIPSITIPPRN